SSRPPVIQRTTNSTTPGLLRLLPAWLASVGVHTVVMSLFLLVTFSATASVETPMDEVIGIGSDVEPLTPPPNLTALNEGLDPQVEAGIPDLDRIGDQNMPGIDNPDLLVGPVGNPELPFVMKPPPGLGNSTIPPSGLKSLTGPVDPFRDMAPPGLPD